MHSTRRKLAIGIAAAFALLLLVAIAVPLAFGDRIASRVKTEINNSVNARVAWSSAGLSLIRDFPNVSLSVDRVSVVGVKPFEGDTLLSLERARLALDLGSVLGYLMRGERIVVREVALSRPAAKLRVLADGTANWDIARTDTAAADSNQSVGVTLRDFRITDGTLSLDDQQSRVASSIKGLNILLDGDFAKRRVVLATRARADTVSFRFAGIPYLSRAQLELNTDIDVDLDAHRITFDRDTLRLNALTLAFGGTVTTETPNVGLDLTFSTPSTAFHDIVSLVPAIYAHDFEKLQTTGRMAVSGRVRGTYGPRAFPALSITAKVENGMFRYPSLPLPARDIGVDLSVENPGGHIDSTVVKLARFHAMIGTRALDGRLVVRTPISDPDVDLRVMGAVDLADVARTVKLENVSELAGLVAADVAMRTRVSDVDAGRYDRVDARGWVNVERVALRSSAIPHAIAVDSASLRLTPRTAELQSFVARIGKSDVRATGSLDNLIGFAMRGDDLRGSATVTSNQFDLNEWRSKDTTEAILVPPNVTFSLKASAGRVLYGPLTISNVRGDLNVKNQRMTVEELQMEMLRGAVVANGFYETTAPARPTFDLGVRLTALDIPSAFASLTTVQMLAPVARWARGSVSGTTRLRGPLDRTMLPLFSALSAQGELETERLVLEGVPAMGKVADALKLELLRQPTLGAIRAVFDVADGRVILKPFTVQAGGVDMRIAGSHGIDQSMKYELALGVPRTLLTGSAGTAVAKLASQAGKAGIDLSAAEAAQIGVQVTGTVTKPEVSVSFAGLANSVRDAAQTAIQQQIATQTNAVKERADSVADEARRRATAEAERIVTAAEQQAATIRADARTFAETLRREGNKRADSLLAGATNPTAKMAAKLAVDRIRREADQQAERGIREADARADSLVARAKRQAAALTPPPD